MVPRMSLSSVRKGIPKKERQSSARQAVSRGKRIPLLVECSSLEKVACANRRYLLEAIQAAKAAAKGKETGANAER